MAVRRVQMDLPEKSFKRLQALRDAVDAASYSEVLKEALRLYEFVTEKDREGCKFVIETKDGKKSELKIFI